jgi:hypothetical protein
MSTLPVSIVTSVTIRATYFGMQHNKLRLPMMYHCMTLQTDTDFSNAWFNDFNGRIFQHVS